MRGKTPNKEIQLKIKSKLSMEEEGAHVVTSRLMHPCCDFSTDVDTFYQMIAMAERYYSFFSENVELPPLKRPVFGFMLLMLLLLANSHAA